MYKMQTGAFIFQQSSATLHFDQFTSHSSNILQNQVQAKKGCFFKVKDDNSSVKLRLVHERLDVVQEPKHDWTLKLQCASYENQANSSTKLKINLLRLVLKILV